MRKMIVLMALCASTAQDKKTNLVFILADDLGWPGVVKPGTKSDVRFQPEDYFPRDPGVPDWMPPSVAVHDGDWKLIRIFNHGKNNPHRYQLYKANKREAFAVSSLIVQKGLLWRNV